MTATVSPVLSDAAPLPPALPSPLPFPKNRIVSHWTKSTPEEGVQVIFNAAEILHAGTNGVKMETHSPSAERPCQWGITLCLAHPPTQRALSPPKTGLLSSSCSVSSTLLILTLDRVLHRDLSTGTGMYMEDPAGASRIRCDAYRTLYIYSPKLKRDICVHPIRRESWPQSIVFDGSSVMENGDQEYHFQIWLAGSSPRQMDAKTNVRLNQCQELLWAMRRDMSTTNVAIFIKDIRAANRDEYSRHEVISERRCHADHVKNIKPLRTRGGSGSNRPSSISSDRNNVKGKNGGSSRVYSVPGAQETIFRAHKCILEATAFFSRMLNGNFRESQADENGVFKIELSSDMFDVEIMDILLDYLYTREPVVDKVESNVHEGYHPPNPPQESQLRHVTSANVGLNLETVITETRKKSLSADFLCLRQRRSHHQRPLSTSEPTLSHWGALYRAAIHLEDKELQALSLQQIQENLDPETTLEQVLSWGHRHEEVKSVMLEYLIKKRREIFGDDHHSKLRPYLWAEYDQQVETLVEITSQIARQ